MTDRRRLARELFHAGIVRLGITVDGQEAAAQPAAALTAFHRACRADPAMGDAWLGRLAAGDGSGETLLGLYTARTTIGAEQRRLGLPPGLLCGRAPTGMFVDHPVADADQAIVAYACSLVAGGDLESARSVLGEADPELPLTVFAMATVLLRQRDWAAVLEALTGAAQWPDPVLATAAELLAGTACVQSGLFDEGIRRLERVRSGPLTNAHAQACFTIGMTLRSRGDEAAAVAAIEEAYALDPGLTEAARALADPGYRLIVGDEPAPEPGGGEADGNAAGGPDESLLAEVERELAEQVGLSAVKAQVARLQSTAMLARVRADRGLRAGERSLHLAFTGPPGTGKTTVARIVAKLYRALGLLATDTVIEASRADLVGTHLGSTAPKTHAVIDAALDGVLLIDEAYTLIQEGLSGGDAFGREALDTLLARMENDRGRLVVIVAGYDDEIDRLLAANEGLASRFARRIRFTSYTPAELTRIAEALADRRDARLTAPAAAELEAVFTELYAAVLPSPAGDRRATDAAGNGRLVRNLIEAAEEERELRLAAAGELGGLSEAELMTITAADVRAACAGLLSALHGAA